MKGFPAPCRLPQMKLSIGTPKYRQRNQRTGMTEPSSRNSELLEIYKLHAEFSDRVAQRREGANRLYVGILTGFLVAVVALTRFGLGDDPSVINVLTFAGGLIGIVLCLSWYLVIRSYRQLNTAKFAVLHELEGKLPFAFFKREWEQLEEGKKLNKYLNITKAEMTLPILFGILFSALAIWGIVGWATMGSMDF